MSQLPINYKACVSLSSLGISNSNFSFSNLSIESEQFVCICDKSKNPPQVELVDVAQSKINSFTITADSARVSPEGDLIALKSAATIQVFNYVKRAKVKSSKLPEEAVFWRWLSPTEIAYVTGTAVYHWNTDPASDATPVKIFDRHPSLKDWQIISYKTDSSKKWCGLVGISKRENNLVGSIQLFSSARGVSQIIEGFAFDFADVLLEGNKEPSNVFVFIAKKGASHQLCINELLPRPEGNAEFPKHLLDVQTPPDAAADLAFAMHHDKESGIVFILTKMAYNYLYDLETGTCLFANRVSNEIVFTTANLSANNGFVSVSRNGAVFSLSINRDTIVPYLLSKNMSLVALKLAMRAGFPGAETTIIAKFNEYFNSNQFVEAARIAAKSPALRNAQTIARFTSASSMAVPGQKSPVFLYYTTIMESGKLNAIESIEFCKPLVQQNKFPYLVNLMRADKFECTEELGDLVRSGDIRIAISIYLHAHAHSKVVEAFAEMGEFDKLCEYCKKVDFKPDFVRILRAICRIKPQVAEKFAKTVVATYPDSVDISGLASCFVECNMTNECISFMVEALKKNDPAQADLQTKLMEMTLMTNVKVAHHILSNNMLTHFNKLSIAKFCEQAGLIQYALEYYTDMYDIQRAITQTHLVDPEWLVSYFGRLSVDDTIACLKIMMETNLRQNLPIVVKVAAKYHDQLGDHSLIKLFEMCRSQEGLFMFLSTIVNYSQDSEVHFKYIQAAVKTNQFAELERICKESNCFEPEKVKNFLKEAKLHDQNPLIIVCDRFDYIDDLVVHFHRNNLLQYIEAYVQRVNPTRLPKIVGALLDVDCSGDLVQKIMLGTPPKFSMSDLVDEVSQRNRIKLIRPFIEARISEGSVDPGDHSALAIVYIDGNNRPEAFLRENIYYDAKIVGKYCESRNPNLACIAYEKGQLDDEMIQTCVSNSLYKNLARYVISRADQTLWAKVLDPALEFRQSVIDQSAQAVLADTYTPERISEMVKAFMTAQLSAELIDLLEKIIFSDSPHKNARNLQNLLLLTALKCDTSRVVDFINRLDNYDAPNIAQVAINYQLYEEAFAIYKKFQVHHSAVEVLADKIQSLDRAYEYAERCNIPAAWTILGKAQLRAQQPREAIDSYIKAEDPTDYVNVIDVSSNFEIHEAMVRYLSMVRATIRDSIVDSEFAYCLGYTHRYDQLLDFLNQPQNVNVIQCGDRLFDKGQYEAAKVFYKYGTNYFKLAATHVKLEEYQLAVDMARKANNTKMWKVVFKSCLTAHEYKFAQICALNLVVHPEELEDLVATYEEMGLFTELMSLIEASVNLERAHMGVFTELAIIYAKYKPEKLKDHLDLYYTRINIPKVLKIVGQYQMWQEMVFLHDKYEEYDQAILTMIKHPAAAFNEPQFRDIIQKVANQDLYHKAISFYYEFKPLMLNDLMIVLSPRIDHSKAISQLKKLNVLPLCRTYLVHVQKLNVAVINEALNSIYVEEENYDDLLASIETYNNYDAIKLSDELSQHESIDMRRISTRIRKLSNRWAQTLEMAKKDNLFDDAILYAAESRDSSIAQSLLEHFISLDRPELIVSLLYFCYDVLKPDNVLEACWINGMSDFCMPYMIQILKDCTHKSKEASESDTSPTNAFTPQQRLMIGNAGVNYSPPNQSMPAMAPQFNRIPHNPFK